MTTRIPTIAIRARTVIAGETDGDGVTSFRELTDAVVLVRGSKIAEVAQGSDAAKLAQGADELIDLGNSVVLPGLIDLEGLVDIDHLNLDSWWGAEHSARLEWSHRYAQSPREVLTPTERSTLREYGIVQLLLHGITTAMPISTEVHGAWAETHDDLLDTAHTASELGLRVFLGPSYRSGVHVVHRDGSPDIYWDEDKGLTSFAGAVQFLETARDLNDPLITGVLVPCRIETVSDDILRRTAAVSVEQDVLVRVHATQEIEGELDILARERQTTPLQLLQEVGLLNERLLLAHGVYIDVHPDVHGEDRGDLALLATAGATVIHCPLTNARYAFWLEKLSQYLKAGVNIALGTDSFPPDLIRAIDAGVQLSKAQHDDLGMGLLAEYVEAATLGGARALRRPDLGRIEVGATADLVAFSLDDFRMGVVDDPIRTLVLSGTARDACFSMVNGRVVMKDGKIPGLDLAALQRDGQKVFEKLRAAYNERDALAGATSADDGTALEPDLFPSVFQRQTVPRASRH